MVFVLTVPFLERYATLTATEAGRARCVCAKNVLSCCLLCTCCNHCLSASSPSLPSSSSRVHQQSELLFLFEILQPWQPVQSLHCYRVGTKRSWRNISNPTSLLQWTLSASKRRTILVKMLSPFVVILHFR